MLALIHRHTIYHKEKCNSEADSGCSDNSHGGGVSLQTATAADGDAKALELIAKYRAEYHVDLDENDKLTVPTDPKTASVEYEFRDDKTVGLSLPAKDDHKDMAEKSEGGVAFYSGDSYDMAVTASESGFSSYIVIHNETAPTRYEFDVTLPTGFKMSENEAGGVNILNADEGVEGIIAAPWAFDADGESVTTQFKLNGDTLVQTVEHAGAAYPVIADPTFSIWGRSINAAEIAWRLLSRWNILTCGIAYGIHGRRAYDSTGSLFGDSGSADDAGDAFRHCYWSARMTIDFGATRAIGAWIAKGFGDRREMFPENTEEARAARRMDLANNAHGRRVGREVAGSSKYHKAESTCYLRSQDGRLQTSP